ncbi:dUTP diphosphatase [Candidatus Nomurabacteria bacterium]|nr:MAG: dUTP diphosphatase [Candidatus Nomurabacteria bacterium]
MLLKIKKLYSDTKLPSYSHPGDVGLDMYSRESMTLLPGDQHIFFVGFALEFPEGYAAIVKDKSGMAKKGLHTMGGVYDAGYRGEYNVQLMNVGKEAYTVEIGDKIAQLILFPVTIATLEEADALSESVRGEGRFGSTGK